MADILVKKGVVKDNRIESLDVGLHGLPDRTIDRDTAVSWMRDGHSFIPVIGGKRQPALQLVRFGDDETPFIRTDNAAVDQDALPF